MNASNIKTLVKVLLLLAVAAIAWYVWNQLENSHKTPGLVNGNGRIEAVEIDIATKLGGRIDQILVDEGQFVQAGQILASMQTDVLNAQLAEAQAQYNRAVNGVLSAEAYVAVRNSDVAAAKAVVIQRESELDAAKRRLARSEVLAREKASSAQELDDNRAQVRSASAAVAAAKAQVAAANAAVSAAQAQVVGAQSEIKAVEATIARIQADIDDSLLKSPRTGRVQYRIAQPGEVTSPGGKLLSLVDLSDVYMTFFIPEEIAGRIAIGAEVRIVLDAAPNYVIPAKISFVDSTAQFTPKTVETEKERQKLMFRVKAKIDPELLEKHLEKVKTGLPGLAWIKVDSQVEWPENLHINVPN
ncbi:HlyD family secretion protein [Thiomicrorhabdus sp. Kp2]|uniref:HlyD family secretion protein n=1 Tax=Thiomicrorhabdus sp. Kp2 TaxID=1123518 RepID=UPI00041AFB28|nr:efflux RND transporter periplasmic adaptor subunit [Thiomicrorhabdus sp. Kp2]